MASEAITQNDLREILSRAVGSIPSEFKKLLWTNPSPTSAFNAQTVSLDLTNYDVVEVEAKTGASIDQYTTHLFDVGGGGIITNFQLNDTWYMRQMTVNSTGIIFANGRYCYMSNGGNGVLDSVCIPTKIYGIKYERVAPPQVNASDYVVEYGTSGIWTYRKWDSGIAECWGTHSATASVSTTWGYTYYGSVSMPNFPSIFIATPSRQATLSTPGGMAWLVPNSSNLSSTSPGGMYIFSGANVGSVSCTISVYAIGRWK